jgi:hypothetical protein
VKLRRRLSGSDPTFNDDGYVGSENSFSATIRTYYSRTAVHGSGDNNFHVRVLLN